MSAARHNVEGYFSFLLLKMRNCAGTSVCGSELPIIMDLFVVVENHCNLDTFPSSLSDC